MSVICAQWSIVPPLQFLRLIGDNQSKPYLAPKTTFFRMQLWNFVCKEDNVTFPHNLGGTTNEALLLLTILDLSSTICVIIS